MLRHVFTSCNNSAFLGFLHKRQVVPKKTKKCAWTMSLFLRSTAKGRQMPCSRGNTDIIITFGLASSSLIVIIIADDSYYLHNQTGEYRFFCMSAKITVSKVSYIARVKTPYNNQVVVTKTSRMSACDCKEDK